MRLTRLAVGDEETVSDEQLMHEFWQEDCAALQVGAATANAELARCSASQRAPDHRVARGRRVGSARTMGLDARGRATHRVLWAPWHVRHVRADERRALLLQGCTKRGAESGPGAVQGKAVAPARATRVLEP
jgi:hypothetical protein